jgi:rSAM/selenodomain-associated transferase 2
MEVAHVDPAVSIIIPVLHESATINDTVLRIRSLEGGRSPEIIVVDGDSRGDTLEAIVDPSVRKVRSPAGRGRQMNEGAGVAKGRVLLFLHADTELPRRGLQLIEAAMEIEGPVAGAFDLGIDSPGFPFRLIEAAASFRSRLNRIPFGDQAIFVRKRYFREIGGYCEIPLMEDVELMRRIKKRGDAIVIINEKVGTSPRRWEKEGILRCTLRNWSLQMLYLSGVSPERLSAYYESHQGDRR